MFRRRATLDQLALRHGTDKSSAANAFTELYEPFLEPLRGEALTLVEVGVLDGASVRLWLDYFPRAQVVAVDLLPERLAALRGVDRVTPEQVDQGDAAALDGLAARLAARRDLRVVIDDGSHLMHHQILTFQKLFPVVVPGGIYFVEDVTTSYDPHHGGGAGRPDTFLRFAKDLVDFVPMSMGSTPPRQPWERDLAFVHLAGHGGLAAVGKLTAPRRERIERSRGPLANG